MIDLTLTIDYALTTFLDTELRTQFGERISGISYGSSKLRIHFYDATTAQDVIDAQAILDVHDPVILTASRDGSIVTVIPSKPRNIDGGTAVNITVNDIVLPESTLIGGTATIVSQNDFTLNVQAYPCDEVVI